MVASETAARCDAACRAFWSDHPLNLYYREKSGLATFSLKAFVAFVLNMPQAEFEQLTRG